MFIILAYDINQKRVGVVHKICRKYLQPIQRSVFEGDLTEKKLENLKKELVSKIICAEDRICIYEFESRRYSWKEEIGVETEHGPII